jgi:transcription elongation factor Elf1
MPPQFKVQKAFPQRGSLRLYRLVEHTAFTCNRCHLEKKSKLVAFEKDKWDAIMCNGCYGLLLSALQK